MGISGKFIVLPVVLILLAAGCVQSPPAMPPGGGGVESPPSIPVADAYKVLCRSQLISSSIYPCEADVYLVRPSQAELGYYFVALNGTVLAKCNGFVNLPPSQECLKYQKYSCNMELDICAGPGRQQNATRGSGQNASAGNLTPPGAPAPPGMPPTASVEITGTVVAPNGTIWAQPGGKLKCSISVQPETTKAGESAWVSYAAYADSGRKLSFSCGNETLGISSGGLVAGSKLCQFNSPGVQEVRIMAGDEVCARTSLTVSPEAVAIKNCYIDQQSITRNLQANEYRARVQFYGFSPGDSLAWQCDNEARSVAIGDAQGTGSPLSREISCSFGSAPASDSIPVSIAGFSCGSIPTR